MVGMEIYFLRHANAGEHKLSPSKDEKRTLDELGIEQSHMVGRGLSALQLKLDEIISSPLARAAETASIVAEEIGHVRKIILDDSLRPEATYSQFEQLLERHANQESIMLVGHNPSMTEFVNRFIGVEHERLELKKAAVIRIQKDSGRAALVKWSMPPKVMRALQQRSAKSSRPKTVSK
jgi:phosphohistidine phosphatase